MRPHTRRLPSDRLHRHRRALGRNRTDTGGLRNRHTTVVLRGHIFERTTGFEPAWSSLATKCRAERPRPRCRNSLVPRLDLNQHNAAAKRHVENDAARSCATPWNRTRTSRASAERADLLRKSGIARRGHTSRYRRYSVVTPRPHRVAGVPL